MRMLGRILGYEISKSMPSEVRTVETPLGRKDQRVLSDPPVLVVILRASLPLFEGLLDIFRDAPCLFVAASRREGVIEKGRLGMEVDLKHLSMVPLRGRTAIIADPMIATGSTIAKLYRSFAERDQAPAELIVAGAIGYEGALVRISEEVPGVSFFVGGLDTEINEKGYIVPGLGDAGDLSFGRKM
jgi:uracil phosphoribosyltransferase